MNVLCISSSPRAKGNSDLLLREAMRGAEAAGAQTEYVSLKGLSMSPCVACNACYRTGRCRIMDPFQDVFAKLLECDRLIFATPVYFMAVCAQGKILIDRCQCLWSQKYILKKPLFPDGPRDRRALVIAAGGSRSRKMFDCIHLTFKYFFDVLEMTNSGNLWVNRVDERGDVLNRPDAMKEAFRLAGELADPARPVPGAPDTVALFEP